MSDEQYRISLRSQSSGSLPGYVSLKYRDNACHLALQSGGETFEAEANDFFEAFSKVREQLWPGGIVPICYGASRNVFPSGMLRDMGGGLKAYRLTLGHPALTKDVVFIFDAGPDVEAVSPMEQRSFFEQWCDSLARK